jgi:probable F420-dependent oxidoreductase
VRIGLFNINSGPCSWPEGATTVATLAEELGYDSVWAGEHVVVPSPRVPPSLLEPTTRMMDPLVTLAFLASATSRLTLAAGLIVLPQRHPLVLAKEAATLDVLSGGRLLLGIGTGYVEPEFEALGIPFGDRGARTDDYLGAMAAIWQDERPSYAGRYLSFSGIDAHPRPTRPGGVPLVFGGHSPAAFRRAVSRGHGWYGFFLSLDETAAALERLRAAGEEVERGPGLPRLEITVTPKGRLAPDLVRRFADLGVDRLVLLPPAGLDGAGLADFVRRHAPAELGASGS